jgi:Astacin (Peptidase family M12A)
LSFKFIRHACVLFVAIFCASLISSQAQQIRQGLYRGMPVTYTVKNGKAMFQGDIVLERVTALNPQGLTPAFGIAYSQYLWPKVGNQIQIPYTIGAGSGDVTNLNAAIAQFNKTFANIKFVALTAQADYVNFYLDPGNFSGECEAIVGRAGGEQQVGGSASCTVATILHEMGHTVGLWHEQSRPDRDAYIAVNYGNLIKGSIGNFNQIADNAQTFGTFFDYASIMEYPAFSFSRNGGPAIESIPAGIPLSNQTGYSSADIDGILRLYGIAPKSVTVTSNPVGLKVIVDGVTVTTPKAFAWTVNSTHTLDIPSGVQTQKGNIANSTTSTTFYYTYGRWNDSTASSHSITVLPGNGEPATPASVPAVTTYSANFIQLVPYAAAIFPVGAGNVAPLPAPQSYPGSALLFFTARQQVTLTATPASGQNFYEFNNAPFWLPGGLGANPKTFYTPDTGLGVNTTVEFSPNPVYTVDVSPNAFSSNLYIYGDGGFSYAPKNFSAFYDSSWTPGSAHTLSTDPLIFPYSSNSRFRFSSWNDGTTTTADNVTLPALSTTYTAALTPEFLLADYANQPCGGSIGVNPASPTGDGFYPAGTGVTLTETPNAGWLFTAWQYDLTGTSASEPLTVTDEALAVADYNTVGTPLTLSSLNPSAAVAGSPVFTLTLNGTGFTPTTLVSVAGIFPVVKFISATQLTVTVTAAQVAKAGHLQVYVENFPSGAGCAAFGFLPFTVANSPIVTPAPLSVAFPAQAVGTTSAVKALKFRNSSTSVVTINSITATGGYVISGNTCGSTLAGGAICTLNVAFAPAVAGATIGSLAIVDSAPDSPQTVALSGTGTLPLTMTPPTISFAAQAVGTTSPAKTVTLTNNQTTALTYSFAASGNFAIASSGTTCTGTLAPAGKCNLAVAFSPTINGMITGAISLTDASSFSPQIISLAGTGSGGGTASLAFSPATLSFPVQAVGTSSGGKAVTVKNTSTGAVTLNSITASGDYSVVGASTKPCSAGLTLAAGATCGLSATFSPAPGASGVVNGSILFTDTGSVSQQVLDAKGTAALPLSFSPTTLAFASQTVATTSAAQSLTVTNNLATSINPVVAGSGDYAVVPGGATPCTGTLAAHAACTITVTFTPTAVGTRASALTFTDSAIPGVQSLSLTGTGQ